MPEPLFYKSSFGDLRLWLSKISTDRSRTQVVHELSSGDEHVVQDRGRGPVRARCTVMFARMKDDDMEPLDRLHALQAIVDDKPRVFSHPSSGSYLARIGPFTEEIDEFGVISAEIEVIQVAPIEAVAPAGAGSIPATGAGAVDAAVAAFRAELADIELESTTPDEVAAAVDRWTSGDAVNTRDVLTQVGSLTSTLGTQADAFDADLELWSAYKATVLLAEAVRAAADSATADTAQTFTMLIAAPVALRAVLASVYSAEETDARYDQALALNDIASPAWLEPGTQLVLPQIVAQARSG